MCNEVSLNINARIRKYILPRYLFPIFRYRCERNNRISILPLPTVLVKFTFPLFFPDGIFLLRTFIKIASSSPNVLFNWRNLFLRRCPASVSKNAANCRAFISIQLSWAFGRCSSFLPNKFFSFVISFEFLSSVKIRRLRVFRLIG